MVQLAAAIANQPAATLSLGNPTPLALNPFYAPSYIVNATPLGQEHLSGLYATGDPVYKAQFTRMGWDPAKQTIVALNGGNIATNTGWRSASAGLGITGFAINYLFQAKPSCAAIALAPVPVTFERTQWAALNGGDHSGYTCLTQIRFDLLTATATRRFVFITNQ